MTQDELAIIAYLERDLGRPLTPQEVRLSLAQARQVGDLPYDPVDGCGYRTEGPLPSNG